ncbi:MAG: DUF294 nucleotidyltransferase-like domain-containing protein [Desulfosalsimonadaceae bacterium]
MENFSPKRQPLDSGELLARQEFLAGVPPFQVLPDAEMEAVAANLTQRDYPGGNTLFVQEETILTHVLIVKSGSLERSIRNDGKETVTERLFPGGVYGGISLLFNNAVSTSTLRCRETASVYELDRENFLRLCLRYPGFAGHFSRAMDEDRQQLAEGGPEPPGWVEEEASFLWEPVGPVARAFPSCASDTVIREAAELLTASRRSAILVLDGAGRPEGIITDDDLRRKVIMEGLSTDEAAASVMSTPLVQAGASMKVFEAVLTMMRHRIKHLPVFEKDRLIGVVTERDLFQARMHSPVYLVHDIQTGQDVAELQAAYARLPAVIRSLIANGAQAGYLNSIITATSDAVLARLMAMALHELGPPPADFAFLLFGSEGRGEQTLKTDQDNAIVYADAGKEEQEAVQRYFLELGTLVCDRLDSVGQQHCEFGIMAKNPQWCQPLSRWKSYYRRWLESDDPERVLKANIFFDFRLGHGNQELVDALHADLFEKLSEWPGFLRQMAKNTVHYRPPLGLFGNFVLQEKEEGTKGFDIKSAMRLVVDFARIYAMLDNSVETNTVKRLELLFRNRHLDRKERDHLVHAYKFLMYQRLKHQSESMKKNNGRPDNFIRPDDLTSIDQQALKEAFKQIRTAHARMRLDFFLYFP